MRAASRSSAAGHLYPNIQEMNNYSEDILELSYMNILFLPNLHLSSKHDKMLRVFSKELQDIEAEYYTFLLHALMISGLKCIQSFSDLSEKAKRTVRHIS